MRYRTVPAVLLATWVIHALAEEVYVRIRERSNT